MRFQFACRVTKASRRAVGKAERGVALFMVLVILIAMMLSSIALVRSVDTTTVIAGNMAFKQGTLMATDVGVEAAGQQLLTLVLNDTTEVDSANYSASFDPSVAVPAQLTAATANALVDVSGTGNTARYWLERMCLTAGPVTLEGCVREEGTDSPYYRVSTRVDGPRGTVSIIQSNIQTPGQFVPQHAILTQDGLQMSSTITISGAGGNVHSNTRVELSGTTVLTLATGAISAVGSDTAPPAGTQGVDCSGTCTGGLTENAPAIPIPQFNPVDYEQYADFKLHKDGKVTNRDGLVLMTAAEGQAGDDWLGWTYTPPGVGAAGAVAEPGTPPTPAEINKLGMWELLNDNSWSSGLLYAEGHVEVSTSPGQTGDPAKGSNPWVISILATGNIRIDNANIQDYRDETLLKWAVEPSPPPGQPPAPPLDDPTTGAGERPPWPVGPSVPVAVQNFFLVAGLDLKLDGTINQVGPEGLFTAREQFTTSGTSDLRGAIITADAYTASNLLTQNQVSGTTTLTYSGNLLTPAVVGVPRRVAWRAMP